MYECENDSQELRELADQYLNTTRCIGKHLVVSGYVCPHCESDEPSAVCHLEKLIQEAELEDQDEKVKKTYTVVSKGGKLIPPSERLSPEEQIEAAAQEIGDLILKLGENNDTSHVREAKKAVRGVFEHLLEVLKKNKII